MKQHDLAETRTQSRGCVSLLAILAAMAPARAEEATPVPDVSVTAPAPKPPKADPSAAKMDGSAEAGYRVKDTTAAGPIWGDLPIQDAPYSINVVPSAMIRNLMTYNLQDALRYSPSVNALNPGNYAQTSIQIRGFSLNNASWAQPSNFTVDGLIGQGGTSFSNQYIEDKERVEVLNGVNGFLYGVGNVAGNINSDLKRPTPVPYFAVNAGTNTGHNGYVHGDVGGPLLIPGLKEGTIGYRLNVVGQSGGTYQ